MIRRKTPPYAGTEVSAEHSVAEINQLLRSYGIDDYQWTTLWSKGVVRLRFMLEVSEGKFVSIEVSPPPFVARRKSWDEKEGKHRVIDAPNWAQSMRCLLHWLKAKLEAVAYGLKSVEEEFLSDLVVKNAQGGDSRVGELILHALEEGHGQLALAPPKPKPEVVDAEYIVPPRSG